MSGALPEIKEREPDGSRETGAYNGGLGAEPQWCPGAELLVISLQSPLKLKALF